MAATLVSHGAVRRLGMADTAQFERHLFRLDKESRYRRFEGVISDSRLADYARKAFARQGHFFGFFDRGVLRGAGELLPREEAARPFPEQAEAAFSVESAHQDGGIGSALADRVVRQARVAGFQRIILNCLPENIRMRRIAASYGGQLIHMDGDCVGAIELPAANLATCFRAGVIEGFDAIDTVLDVSRVFTAPED